MTIKNNFFSAILAAVTLLACNNDDINLLSPDDGEQGYLVLTLETPPTLRTLVGEGTEIGLDEESKINSLAVVLTNETGTVSAVLKPSISNGVTEKFKVALGTHYVYALVNSPIEVTPNENIHRVIDVASATEATSGYKNGSFLMVNQRNSSLANAGVATEITVANIATNPKQVKIQVDRAACKIVDETGNPGVERLSVATNGFVDKVDVEGFVILNVNKQFNFVQKWDADDVLETPTYNGLVASQFFHNVGEYTTLQKDNDGKIIGITDKTAGVKGLYGNGPVYTTENSPKIMKFGDNELTAGRGETTGVIYKVQAKRGSDNLGTFFRYRGVAYSDLTGIQEMPEFKDKITLNPSNFPELRALGISVYEDGIMYYTYFVRDPNVTHQYQNKNYYGVFRNSVYKLTINSISGLGDDVPGGGFVDPEDPNGPGNPPIDSDEAYIEVSIAVNPWVLNTIKIDF